MLCFIEKCFIRYLIYFSNNQKIIKEFFRMIYGPNKMQHKDISNKNIVQKGDAKLHQRRK